MCSLLNTAVRGRSTRRVSVAGIGLLASACTFGGAAVTSAAGTEDTSGSETADAQSTVTGSGQSDENTTTRGGADESAASSRADTQTDTDKNPTSDGVPVIAKLEFEAPEMFGPTPYRTPVTRVLTVVNVGALAATQIAEGDLHPSFQFSGGSFPGERGDCSPQLDPGEFCQVELAFGGAMLGRLSAVFALDYVDGTGSERAEVTLDALVEGSTGNLIANPGFEDEPTNDEPIPSWTALSGLWSISPQAHTGAAAAYGGASANGPTEHRNTQEIDVARWETSIDAGEIDIALSGWLRADYNEQGVFRVALVDAEGNETALDSDIVTGPGTSMQATVWSPVAPEVVGVAVGTRTLRVEAICIKQGGQHCDVYFDDVSLVATYNPR